MLYLDSLNAPFVVLTRVREPSEQICAATRLDIDLDENSFSVIAASAGASIACQASHVSGRLTRDHRERDRSPRSSELKRRDRDVRRTARSLSSRDEPAETSVRQLGPRANEERALDREYVWRRHDLETQPRRRRRSPIKRDLTECAPMSPASPTEERRLHVHEA